MRALKPALIITLPFLLCALLGTCIEKCHPQTVSGPEYIQLEWSYTGVENDLAGFRVYSSKESGIYTYGKGNEVVEISKETLEATIDDPVSIFGEGDVYFVVTAFDTAQNESGPSNEVHTTIDKTTPHKPHDLKLILKINIVIGD